MRHDGRANPNQLMITRDTLPDLARLRQALVESAPRPPAARPTACWSACSSPIPGASARPNDKKRPEPMHRSTITRCSTASWAALPIQPGDER